MNQVSISGYLTKDAQIKHIGQKQTPCVEFSIGKTHRFKNERGNIEEKAMFFDITLFGNYAERMLPNLTKGSQAFIQGTLNYENWEKDDKKHSKVTIIAQRLYVSSKANDLTDSKTQNNIPNQDHQEMQEQKISGEEFMQQFENQQNAPYQNPPHTPQNHA